MLAAGLGGVGQPGLAEDRQANALCVWVCVGGGGGGGFYLLALLLCLLPLVLALIADRIQLLDKGDCLALIWPHDHGALLLQRLPHLFCLVLGLALERQCSLQQPAAIMTMEPCLVPTDGHMAGMDSWAHTL